MGLFDGINNPWAPGGQMASRLPWAQAGHSYGWGHGNEFFHPKTKEQIQKEAMLQLAILAAVLVAPAIVDAGGGAGASAKKVAKKSTLRKFCSFIVMILMWQMTFSQWSFNDFRCISNRTIEFEIVRTSLQLQQNNTVTPSKYRYVVRSNDCIDSLDQTRIKFMVDNFQNLEYDWGFNITLYSYFGRDAYLIMNSTPNEWRVLGKADDWAYWKKEITKRID